MTLFESVGLCDELTVSSSSELDGADEVVCAGVEGPNLVSGAIAGLRAHGWAAPALRVEITKRIPIAGGMAGGSADAAALLRIAPRLAAVSRDQLGTVAASLGADVPAQLTPGLAVGTGAGEKARPVAPLAAHGLLIVPLAAELSTAAVYAEADRQGILRSGEELAERLAALEEALAEGARLPGSLLVNDLEPAARALCPRIADCLDAVERVGADHVLVCGSGPTVAGVFWGADGLARARGAAESLRGQFPGASGVAPVSSRPSGKIDRS